MSLQLRVSHITGYKYDGVVTSSYNEARMTPVTSPGQLVLNTRLDVSPSPWSYKYRDYWGSMVTAFEVHGAHKELTLDATTTVQVNRQPVAPASMTWKSIVDPALADRLCEYLAIPDRVAPSPEFGAQCEELLEGSSGPTDFAHAVCFLVHEEMAYVTRSTQVHSTAAEAWADRQGVCQDFAHLCIGALRAAGVPARYVSGYLHPHSKPEIGETVLGESHAWIEWWDGAWIGFDPTNEVTPDNRYIVVGSGRDYADVAPLTGIFSGGEHSSMFVEVSLTRTA